MSGTLVELLQILYSLQAENDKLKIRVRALEEENSAFKSGTKTT